MQGNMQNEKASGFQFSSCDVCVSRWVKGVMPILPPQTLIDGEGGGVECGKIQFSPKYVIFNPQTGQIVPQ